jgi:hypothetical protein
MPGEERKFNRRSIVAFIPTCKRGLEPAASHTSIVVGIAAMGVVIDSMTSVAVGSWISVGVNSIIGVTVKEGSGVAIIAEVLVGAIFVCVEEDIGIAVAGVVMDGKVACGDDVGFNAAVDRRESEAVGAIAGVGDSASEDRYDVEVDVAERRMAD